MLSSGIRVRNPLPVQATFLKQGIGLTIKDVAEKIGAGPRAVMDAEKGKPSTSIAVYANAENILSQSARFLLEQAEAEAIVREMKGRVEQAWYETARTESVSERDCGLISGAFAYPGIGFETEQIAAEN